MPPELCKDDLHVTLNILRAQAHYYEMISGMSDDEPTKLVYSAQAGSLRRTTNWLRQQLAPESLPREDST